MAHGVEDGEVEAGAVARVVEAVTADLVGRLHQPGHRHRRGGQGQRWQQVPLHLGRHAEAPPAPAQAEGVGVGVRGVEHLGQRGGHQRRPGRSGRRGAPRPPAPRGAGGPRRGDATGWSARTHRTGSGPSTSHRGCWVRKTSPGGPPEHRQLVGGGHLAAGGHAAQDGVVVVGQVELDVVHPGHRRLDQARQPGDVVGSHRLQLGQQQPQRVPGGGVGRRGPATVGGVGPARQVRSPVMPGSIARNVGVVAVTPRTSGDGPAFVPARLPAGKIGPSGAAEGRRTGVEDVRGWPDSDCSTASWWRWRSCSACSWTSSTRRS